MLLRILIGAFGLAALAVGGYALLAGTSDPGEGLLGFLYLALGSLAVWAGVRINEQLLARKLGKYQLRLSLAAALSLPALLVLSTRPLLGYPLSETVFWTCVLLLIAGAAIAFFDLP
jgi:hypothetical protein